MTYEPHGRTSHVSARPLVQVLIAILFELASGAPSRAQATPDIEHDPLQCIGVGAYPVIDAAIEPGKEVRTAKVYFRAEHFPKFYWVEMVIHEDNFVSVLPKPSPGTKRIVYYIAAMDSAFNNAVDPEHDPEILEVCKEVPAYAPGDEPGIIVGATEAGAAPLPPGFEAAGIIGTVATTGLLSTGLGGGAGVGTAAAVGAAAAGTAAGVVVATNQSPPEESTTSVVPTGLATTTIVPTPGSPGGTTTIPEPGGTTTVASTTTTTIAGSNTTTTTSAPATTTTLPALDASCFTMSVLGACRVQVDATCVTLPVDRYEWLLDVSDKWRRIDIPDGPASFIQDWSGDCESQDETIQFRL